MQKHAVQFVQIHQQIFCAFVINHAVLRQADAAGSAVQQLSAKRVLQRLDLPRDTPFGRLNVSAARVKLSSSATRRKSCIAYILSIDMGHCCLK